ncbi:MAG: toprim domain-containing protein [Leptolyngbyaceae cyanobacterium RM1_406_9]|nr:toprim domain-containing protein [Leptolyngbyaceae cyanobacterium RM1_406_9]
MVWFTWLPAEAKETWLCESEWDAMLLGWMLRKADLPIAVASFTCGSGHVPPTEQLQKLPGQVTIFYDWDESGEKGSRKAALALNKRSRIAQVPKPDNCPVKGWDVSNAINASFTLTQFAAAASNAVKPALEPRKENPLRARLVTKRQFIFSSDHPESDHPMFVTNILDDHFRCPRKKLLLGQNPGKRGWQGKVVRLLGEDNLYALVHWMGDRRACRELLEDLELVEEGDPNA